MYARTDVQEIAFFYKSWCVAASDTRAREQETHTLSKKHVRQLAVYYCARVAFLSNEKGASSFSFSNQMACHSVRLSL